MPSSCVAIAESLAMEKGKTEKNDPLEAYMRASRWIPLSISPFLNFTTLFYGALAEERESEGKEFSDEDAAVFERIMDLVPTFYEVLVEFAKDQTKLDKFINRLNSAANSARQEDTGSLKNPCLDYIPPDPETDVLEPLLPKSSPKCARGFNHPATGRLLCPKRMLGEFDGNPLEFMAAVNDGSIKIKATQWPSFMYDEDVASGSNSENIGQGLCRGYFLLRVFRHIFTSPSSAITKHARGLKPSKAQLHGLTNVAGRTIAYAAVQARFILSSVGQWSRYNAHFDFEAFHDRVVTLFELRPNHPWVKETLEWWNKQVPGLASRSRKRKKELKGPDSDDSEEELIDKVFEQWDNKARQQDRTRSLDDDEPEDRDPQPKHSITPGAGRAQTQDRSSDMPDDDELESPQPRRFTTSRKATTIGAGRAQARDRSSNARLPDDDELEDPRPKHPTTSGAGAGAARAQARDRSSDARLPDDDELEDPRPRRSTTSRKAKAKGTSQQIPAEAPIQSTHTPSEDEDELGSPQPRRLVRRRVKRARQG